MFRRRKATCTFDPFYGDAEVVALRRSLEAGDIGPLTAAYAQADPHRREVLAHSLTLNLPPVPVIDQWPQAAPDSALAFLMRGTQGIAVAWELRGRGYIETVDPEGWQKFYDRLKVAEADLRMSIELDDGDGVAWSSMLVTGRGLQKPVDELRERYRRAITAAPGLAFAADQLHQSLCAKWFGSHEEMFAFARSVCADAGPGDLRHRLIPASHFERALEFREDHASQEAYRRSREAQDEIIAAAEASVFWPDFGTTAQHVLTVNWFALGLAYFGQAARARSLFESIGQSPTLWPWEMFNDPARVFTGYRLAAGAG